MTPNFTGSWAKRLEAAAPLIFDFEFPIWSEQYRVILESKILRHYFTREIGVETVGLWKFDLETKLNEIMPYYNELYKTTVKDYDYMTDTDITEDFKGDEQRKEYTKYDSTQNTDQSTTDTTSTNEDNTGNVQGNSSVNQSGKIDVNGNVTTDQTTNQTGTVDTTGTVDSVGNITNADTTDRTGNTDNTSTVDTTGKVTTSNTETNATHTAHSDFPQQPLEEGIDYATWEEYTQNNRTQNGLQDTTNKQVTSANQSSSDNEVSNRKQDSTNNQESESHENSSNIADSNTNQDSESHETSTNTTSSTSNEDSTGNLKSQSNSHGDLMNSVEFNSTNNLSTDKDNSHQLHRKGANGSRSFTQLLVEYRDSLLNIDMMIINELSDLFMKIY